MISSSSALHGSLGALEKKNLLATNVEGDVLLLLIGEGAEKENENR